MFGFLCLDKPLRKTSRDAVDQVQRKVKPAKVGHAGTLDPLATGVLVVAIGGATRLIDWVQQQQKTYDVVFRFGVRSDTDDLEGELLPVAGPLPTPDAIEQALPLFLGWIQQVPPVYSAIKVEGRRAYDLARKGREVILEPRAVRIDSLTILSYNNGELRLRVQCGAGTYIRSLGRDLARALGTEAVMVELRRSAIGGFHVEEGLEWERLREASVAELEQRLMTPAQALPSLDIVELDGAGIRRLQLGRVVPLEQTPLLRTGIRCETAVKPDDVAAGKPARYALGHDSRGKLAALLQETEVGWKVEKAFWDDADFKATVTEPVVVGESHQPGMVMSDLLQSERQLWAAELHDGVVQELAGAKMLLEGIISTGTDRVEMIGRLSRVVRVLDRALQEARGLLHELHESPAINDSPLTLWLQDDDERRAEYPLVTQLFSVAVVPTDPSVARDVRRLIQEGARNALRHASASKVSISLEILETDGAMTSSRAALRLTICDDGSGFDPMAVPDDRFGLRGIRTRAARSRGTATWTSPATGGTCLQIDWPPGVVEFQRLDPPIQRGLGER